MSTEDGGLYTSSSRAWKSHEDESRGREAGRGSEMHSDELPTRYLVVFGVQHGAQLLDVASRVALWSVATAECMVVCTLQQRTRSDCGGLNPVQTAEL